MNRDIIRQLGVTACAVICVYGTLMGIGVFGTRVEESSGGRLAADATLIAPAGGAFSIWSLIYLGLFAFVVRQWLPGQRATSRYRAAGWLAAASMLLNAAWLLVTQQGWIVVSVAVILVLLITLGVLVQRLHDDPAHGWAERIVVDATFGAYLGWVCVATCANIAAAVVESGMPATGTGPTIAALLVLVVVALVGLRLAKRLPGQYPVAAALVWGLAWVAYGRLADQPRSVPVAMASGLAAIVVATSFVRSRPTAGLGRARPRVSTRSVN